MFAWNVVEKYQHFLKFLNLEEIFQIISEYSDKFTAVLFFAWNYRESTPSRYQAVAIPAMEWFRSKQINFVGEV